MPSEGVDVFCIIQDQKTQQLTIFYRREGKFFEQSGLGVVCDGMRHFTEREKDGVFYELLFECVSTFHKEKEITWEYVKHRMDGV